jgi:hypothetical protein
MTEEDLKELQPHSLLYLASPYSKYPAGIEQAFIDVSKLTGRLLKHGVTVYSPIAHMHPVAVHGQVDPYDHKIWLPLDEVMMGKCEAMLVAMMPTWEISKGIKHEIDFFLQADKPVFYLNPDTMELL